MYFKTHQNLILLLILVLYITSCRRADNYEMKAFKGVVVDYEGDTIPNINVFCYAALGCVSDSGLETPYDFSTVFDSIKVDEFGEFDEVIKVPTHDIITKLLVFNDSLANFPEYDYEQMHSTEEFIIKVHPIKTITFQLSPLSDSYPEVIINYTSGISSHEINEKNVPSNKTYNFKILNGVFYQVDYELHSNRHTSFNQIEFTLHSGDTIITLN